MLLYSIESIINNKDNKENTLQAKSENSTIQVRVFCGFHEDCCVQKLAACLVCPLVGSQQTYVQTNKRQQTYKPTNKHKNKKQTQTHLVSSLRTGPWSDLNRSSFIFLARVL